jgi:hypothetical protein
MPARRSLGNLPNGNGLPKKLASTLAGVLYPANVSGIVTQDRTVVLTIYRSDRHKAKSDVGRTDQNGSKKTRRVKPSRLSRFRSRTCPI